MEQGKCFGRKIAIDKVLKRSETCIYTNNSANSIVNRYWKRKIARTQLERLNPYFTASSYNFDLLQRRVGLELEQCMVD